jgi:hypothetical protein
MPDWFFYGILFFAFGLLLLAAVLSIMSALDP